MTYHKQLKLFLEQTKTDNLTTKQYEREYFGLKVKVGFGKGNKARIPWISFLKGANTTMNGIYPVYLYYKEFDLLILAYGISETNKPKIEWNIKNKKTIKEYFEEKYSQKPARYGQSFVFKTYDGSLMKKCWLSSLRVCLVTSINEVIEGDIMRSFL